MKEKDEIERIVEGCLKEDRRYQHRLYELFYSKLAAVCMRYAKDRDDAQDIVQDGFIKIFNNIKNFNKSGSFEGWMKRIMVNTSIDYYRRGKKIQFQFDSDIIEKISDTAEEEEQDSFEFLDVKPEELVEKIQKLSPAYRTIFNMYVVEDYTHKEIAETLGISEGTSKSNLAKAKKNLQKMFKDKEYAKR